MNESTEGTPTRQRQIEIDKEKRLHELTSENTRLQARVSELEKENAELLDIVENVPYTKVALKYKNQRDDLTAENTKLQARIDKLKKYAKHETNCKYVDIAMQSTYVKDNKMVHEAHDSECDCGLIEALGLTPTKGSE